MEFIDGILMPMSQAPKKQRHTARRIWQRIGQERPQASVGEARYAVMCAFANRTGGRCGGRLHTPGRRLGAEAQ